MSSQRTLFDAPCSPLPARTWPEPTPREIGQERGEACEAKAEIELSFDTIAAARDALAWLNEGGPASGEEIVNHLKRLGHKPHDDRAFGPVFARLVREGSISFVGYAVRQKGHGTIGAKVWRATQQETREDLPNPNPLERIAK